MLVLGWGIRCVSGELFPKSFAISGYTRTHPSHVHTILAQTGDLAWLLVYDNFMTSAQPVRHKRACYHHSMSRERRRKHVASPQWAHISLALTVMNTLRHVCVQWHTIVCFLTQAFTSPDSQYESASQANKRRHVQGECCSAVAHVSTCVGADMEMST